MLFQVFYMNVYHEMAPQFSYCCSFFYVLGVAYKYFMAIILE